jgi:hypothetical protein
MQVSLTTPELLHSSTPKLLECPELLARMPYAEDSLSLATQFDGVRTPGIGRAGRVQRQSDDGIQTDRYRIRERRKRPVCGHRVRTDDLPHEWEELCALAILYPAEATYSACVG